MKANIPHDFIVYLNRFSLESILSGLSRLAYNMYNSGKSARDKFLSYREYSVDINGANINKKAQINQCFIVDILYECIIRHRGHSTSIITEDELYLLIAYYNDYYVKNGLGKSYNKERVFLQAFAPAGEIKRFQREHLCPENYARESYIIDLMINGKCKFDDKLLLDDLYLKNHLCSKEKFETIILFLLILSILKDSIYTRQQIISVLANCKITESVETIESILDAYSADIEEIKASALKRQIFYLKPIIKMGDVYIFSSPYLMWFLFENCNYWMIRNYYYGQHSQKFINAFGIYFEKYVEEVLSYCLPYDGFKRIPSNNKEKRADWYITVGDIDIIIEQKSCLSEIGIKQQVIDLKRVENHIASVFGEAILQLFYTEQAMKKQKTIKIILLYEDYFNNACLKDVFRLKSDLVDDGEYWLLNIREFEMLMYCYKMNKELFNSIINKKYKSHPVSYAESLEDVMSKCGVVNNDYIYDNQIINYYQKATDRLINKLNELIGD